MMLTGMLLIFDNIYINREKEPGREREIEREREREREREKQRLGGERGLGKDKHRQLACLQTHMQQA